MNSTILIAGGFVVLAVGLYFFVTKTKPGGPPQIGDAPPPPGWKPNTNYKAGDIVDVSGKQIMADNDGKSGATLPQLSAKITDGTITWYPVK